MASDRLVRALAVTVELTNTEVTREGAAVMVEDLSRYPEAAVLAALTRCRREVRGRLSIADVISRIDDGRPSADEAWAMMPRDEDDTVVWTAEMRDAYTTCKPLLDEGDTTAARYAFRTAYQRHVDRAREAAVPAAWAVSLGHNHARRELAIRSAVESGRLRAEDAARLLPAPEATSEGRALISSALDAVANPSRRDDVLGALRRMLRAKIYADRDARLRRMPIINEPDPQPPEAPTNGPDHAES